MNQKIKIEKFENFAHFHILEFLAWKLYIGQLCGPLTICREFNSTYHVFFSDLYL